MQSVKPPVLRIAEWFSGQESFSDLELALWIMQMQESQARLGSISHIKYLGSSYPMSHASQLPCNYRKSITLLVMTAAGSPQITSYGSSTFSAGGANFLL